jgi:hypothetical protein
MRQECHIIIIMQPRSEVKTLMTCVMPFSSYSWASLLSGNKKPNSFLCISSTLWWRKEAWTRSPIRRYREKNYLPHAPAVFTTGRRSPFTRRIGGLLGHKRVCKEGKLKSYELNPGHLVTLPTPTLCLTNNLEATFQLYIQIWCEEAIESTNNRKRTEHICVNRNSSYKCGGVVSMWRSGINVEGWCKYRRVV